MSSKEKRLRQRSPFDAAPKNGWLIAAVFAVVAFIASFVAVPVLAVRNADIAASSVIIKSVLVAIGALSAVIALIRIIKLRRTRADELPPSALDTVLVLPSTSDPTVLAANRGWKDVARVRAKRREMPVIKPSKWSLELIQSLGRKNFENLCCAYYSEKGLRSEVMADDIAGIGLFQTNAHSPDAIMQCIAESAVRIEVQHLHVLKDAMSRGNVDKGFCMTSGNFSDEAKNFCSANRIVAVDGKLFLAMIGRLHAEARLRLLNIARDEKLPLDSA